MSATKVTNPRVDKDGRECTACHKYQAWDQYSKMKAGANGRCAKCKSCMSLKAKAARVYAEKPYKDSRGMACVTCGEYKLYSEYVKDKTTSSGYASGCKSCRYARSTKWHLQNPEAAKLAVSRWVAQNLDHVRENARKVATAKREALGAAKWCEYVKQYRVSNYEVVRARELANERKHREVRNFRLKEGRKREPHVYAAYDAKKHHKRGLRLVSWADAEAIAAVYAKAQFLTASTGIEHHVDHVYPLLGKYVSGLHVAGNLQVLTKTENIRKGNRLDPEYLPEDVVAELA